MPTGGVSPQGGAPFGVRRETTLAALRAEGLCPVGTSARFWLHALDVHECERVTMLSHDHPFACYVAPMWAAACSGVWERAAPGLPAHWADETVAELEWLLKAVARSTDPSLAAAARVCFALRDRAAPAGRWESAAVAAMLALLPEMPGA